MMYWPKYVPVAKRREKAVKKMAQLKKKGKNIEPIEIKGNKIAKSFWGKAWCDHLEGLSDYENRLPRGRTYARNGSVCHLGIKKGAIEALVSGSSIYEVKASITPLKGAQWKAIKNKCSGQITSVLDLLKGKVSDGVMAVVADKTTGLFPRPREIEFSCNCPDGVSMCKHIAAVLYGVGARLDHSPELLFLLRAVDHQELISAEISLPEKPKGKRSLQGDLGDIFGIDLDDDIAEAVIKPTTLKRTKVVKEKAKKRTRPFTITVKGIVRMRKKFGMTYSQFATLVGASPATIQRWEQKEGELNLRPNHLTSLKKLKGLSREEAWCLLD